MTEPTYEPREGVELLHALDCRCEFCSAIRTEEEAEAAKLDYDPRYYRIWMSPNHVDHLVNRRTGGCMTCGRRHEIDK